MGVAVIGGGIIGLASAYYLRQREIPVTVLEKSTIGAGSTDRANGGIRAQFSTPVSIALSQESIRVWERFETEFGVDIGYRRPGYLFLARTERTAAQFRDNVATQQRYGVPSRCLTPEEALDHCPELNAENYVAATYSPTDGFADPHLALQGFSQAVEEAGADVRTGVEVTDITRYGSDGRVSAVETTDGRIGVDHVVNAAGPWAGEVATMAGIDLPVTPKRRKLMVADPDIPVPQSVPLTSDLDNSVHFRPERDGGAVVGGHFSSTDPPMDPDTYRQKTSLGWAGEAIERAAECAAYFGPDTEVRRSWAGLYTVTPDHHPIIEETVPGLITAAGFSGHGFMQSPATGRVVAELVADGEASLVDVSPLSSNRFETGELLEEGTVIN